MASSKFRKNTVWSIAEYTIYPLLMVVATPVFLNRLGAEQYGLWMLYNTLIQFAIIFNFGIGDSTIRLIAEALKQGDEKKPVAVVEHNLRMAWMMFLLFAGVGVALFFIGRWSGLERLPGLDSEVPFTILVPAAFSAGFKFIELVGLSFWKGIERFDMASRFTLFGRSFIVLSNVLLVLFDFSLYFILITTACLQGLVVLVQFVFVKRQLPSLRLFPLRSAVDRSYMGYNFWYWMQSAIGAIGFTLDKTLVALLTDLATFGYYAIASMVGTQIHNLLAYLGSFVFPRSAGVAVDDSSQRRTYVLHSSVVEMIGWTACLLLLVVGEWPLSLWLGDQYEHAALFIRLYVCYESLLLLTIVPYQMINGSPVFRLNSLYELLFRLLQFAGMVSAYFLMGSDYIILGLIAGVAIILPVQYGWLSTKVMQRDWWRFYPEFLCAALLLGFAIVRPGMWDYVLGVSVLLVFVVAKLRPALHVYKNKKHA